MVLLRANKVITKMYTRRIGTYLPITVNWYLYLVLKVFTAEPHNKITSKQCCSDFVVIFPIKSVNHGLCSASSAAINSTQSKV